MKIRTPLGLFVATVGVGFLPAVGVGAVIGVSNTSYEPVPQPQKPPSVVQNYGNADKPYKAPASDTGKQRRVESGKRQTPQVKQGNTPEVGVQNSTRAQVPDPGVRPSLDPPIPQVEPSPNPACRMAWETCEPLPEEKHEDVVVPQPAASPSQG